MSSHALEQSKFTEMTTKSVPGLIARLAVPTIVSMLVTSLYNMADTYYMGKVSTAATAAVGIAFPVMASVRHSDSSSVTARVTSSHGGSAPATSRPPSAWPPRASTPPCWRAASSRCWATCC